MEPAKNHTRELRKVSPSSSPWAIHPGLDSRLIALHQSDEKLSNRDIAKRLSREFAVDLSRNAIISRSRRLKLKRDPLITLVPTPARIAKRSPKPRTVHAAKPAVVPNLVVRPTAVTALPPKTLSLMELDCDNCRYPFGDQAPYRFCGCRILKGSPYCQAHDQIIRNYSSFSSCRAARSQTR